MFGAGAAIAGMTAVGTAQAGIVVVMRRAMVKAGAAPRAGTVGTGRGQVDLNTGAIIIRCTVQCMAIGDVTMGDRAAAGKPRSGAQLRRHNQ